MNGRQAGKGKGMGRFAVCRKAEASQFKTGTLPDPRANTQKGKGNVQRQFTAAHYCDADVCKGQWLGQVMPDTP